METRANYVIIGLFVLAFLIGTASFVAWVGRVSLQPEVDTYRVVFEGPVTGLQEGAVVRYSGIVVGSVGHLGFDPARIGQVQALIDIDPGTPIPEGSEVAMEVQGLTGAVSLQIVAGPGPELIDPGAEGSPPTLVARSSGIAAVLEGVPDVLARTTALLDQANGFLSDDNQRTITEILINVRALTEVLAEEAGALASLGPRMDGLLQRVDGLVERTGTLVESVDGLVADARGGVDGLTGRLDAVAVDLNRRSGAAIDEFRQTAISLREVSDSFGETADELTLLVRGSSQGLADFANTGLYEFTLAVSEVRGLTQSLSRLADQVERDPAQFLFGGSGAGVAPE